MERLRAEARESIETERREARSARDELSATVHALRAYYEGQRLGAERARAEGGVGGASPLRGEAARAGEASAAAAAKAARQAEGSPLASSTYRPTLLRGASKATR